MLWQTTELYYKLEIIARLTNIKKKIDCVCVKTGQHQHKRLNNVLRVLINLEINLSALSLKSDEKPHEKNNASINQTTDVKL